MVFSENGEENREIAEVSQTMMKIVFLEGVGRGKRTDAYP
jgi:hypothetical protein